MPATFELEIHTPQRLFFSGPVEEIVVALEDGECGILKDHARCAAPIVPCIARIKQEDGTWARVFLAEGIIEVKRHKTIILACAAERPAEIDAGRARASQERARALLEGQPGNVSASRKLRKARLRLELAGAG
jgi:F-type H+-transporting ATPase subunit epsilon